METLAQVISDDGKLCTLTRFVNDRGVTVYRQTIEDPSKRRNRVKTYDYTGEQIPSIRQLFGLGREN